MTQKKNGFLRFVFSLLPGAGEMYMGFMKMGISLMGAFFGIVALATWLDIGPLMFVAAILWFYSFFHVHNLASMPDEEFYALEDEYLFHFSNGDVHQGADFVKIYRKAIGVTLIVVGVILSWKSLMRPLENWIPEDFYWILRNLNYYLPQLIIGIAVIVLGVHMISGKKKQLDSQDEKQVETTQPDSQQDGKEQ